MLPIHCRSPLGATGIVILLLSTTVVISGCVRSPVDPVVVELRWAYLDSCVWNEKDTGLHRVLREQNQRVFRHWYDHGLLDTSNGWHAANVLRNAAIHSAKPRTDDSAHWNKAEASSYDALWSALFIEGFQYSWRDTVLATPHVRRAVRFEGRRCFWRIAPTDLDTVKDYVRTRTHVLGLAVAGDPPYDRHILNLVDATGPDIAPDTLGRSKQLAWLNKQGDHVTAYFHGLELSVHGFVERKATQDSTCLTQQIQLVELDPYEKPGCDGAEP